MKGNRKYVILINEAEVYIKAFDLAMKIFQITKTFPEDEKRRMNSQTYTCCLLPTGHCRSSSCRNFFHLHPIMNFTTFVFA
jgi:hypothetical protein